jgi:hypothetical protein
VHKVRSPLLSAWPLPVPTNWVEIVNQPQTEAELAAFPHWIQRGCPYGRDEWTEANAKSLDRESTL